MYSPPLLGNKGDQDVAKRVRVRSPHHQKNVVWFFPQLTTFQPEIDRNPRPRIVILFVVFLTGAETFQPNKQEAFEKK